MTKCNLYNNHVTIKSPAVKSTIQAKFIKKEELAYNVVVQWWLWYFIPSLFLNPLAFFMPKYDDNMGHICVDGTNTIAKTDNGATNQQIPKPGTPSQFDKNPPIKYGTALECCLTWIYNAHINYPSKDLLMLPNDISLAFHQIFYPQQ